VFEAVELGVPWEIVATWVPLEATETTTARLREVSAAILHRTWDRM
jgi:hypothetical protein